MLKITSDKDITDFPKCPITGLDQPPVNKGDVYFVLNEQEITSIKMLAQMLSKNIQHLPSVQERLKRVVVQQEQGEQLDNFNIMHKAQYAP